MSIILFIILSFMVRESTCYDHKGCPSERVRIQPYFVTEFPSKQGEPVDYIIVTTEKLKPAFEGLRDWKREKGVNCAIRTVEWICQNYPGCDTPERIRNFLRDAYNGWGTRWVLLGGDVSEVPIRDIRSTNHYSPYYNIATDMYYACLDGSWNANDNDAWGEVEIVYGNNDTVVASDSTTYDIHLYVGRFLGDTTQEIEIEVNKTVDYEKGLTGYKNRILLVGGILRGDGTESAKHCSTIANCFPTYFEKDMVFGKTNFYFSAQEFVDTLQSGYGYVYVVTHGSPSQDWNYPRGFNRKHADAINCVPFFITVVSCYSNWIEVDCLARRFMLNPDGGTFGYQGSDRVGWDQQELSFNKHFYAKLFQDTSGDSTTEIGKLFGYAKSKLVPFIFPGGREADNNYRDTYMSYLLLADPELRLWTNYPDTLEVDFPDIVDIGESQFKVSVKDHSLVPIANACVCVSRNNELYARGLTDTNGEITFVLCPEAAGVLKLVVTKQNFLPYEGSIFVNPTKPYVRYKTHFTIGKVDAGEEFTLKLTLENTGNAKASNVIAKLTPNSPLVTMLGSIQYYDTLGPSCIKTRDYKVKLDKQCPGQTVNFSVSSQYEEGTSKDTFNLPIHAPELSHYTHSINKESISQLIPTNLSLKIKNCGNGNAPKVVTKLRYLGPEISVIDSVEEMDAVAAFSIQSFTNCFAVIANTPVQNPKFVLEIEDSFCRKWVDTFEVKFLKAPDNLYTRGVAHGVNIVWKPPETSPYCEDIYGFNVYRAPDSSLLDFWLIDVNPVFADMKTDEYKIYSYWVTTVDRNLNESWFSSQVDGMPNPFFKHGWPRKAKNVNAYFISSPAVANIDGSTPELEVVINGDDGVLYSWHHNGQGVLSPDGVFVENLGSCWNSVTVADINNDGALETIRLQSFTGDGCVYVFKNDGTLLPGFPVHLQQDWGGFSTPTVQDIDGDGMLEIIIAGHAYGDSTWKSHVYVFRADGTGFLNPDGIFATRDGSGNGGAPGCADIDCDGTLEIIIGCSGKVYAWKPNGELLPNWPVNILGDPSSPAIGDIDPSYPGLEVAIHSSGHWLYVWHADASLFWKKKCYTGADWRLISSPALGDIDGDGMLEIALTGTNRLHLWNHDSTFVRNKDGVPVESLGLPFMDDVSKASPLIGDVDGDDEPEILIVELHEGSIYGFERDGTFAPGFPIMANGLMVGTPTLADIDLDGHNELLAGTNTPDVRIWGLLGNKIEWGTLGHDRWHTGLYGFIPPDTLGVHELALPQKQDFKLFQNMPNPFTKLTSITFQIPAFCHSELVSESHCKVSLKIYDVAGRLARTLVDKQLPNGPHTIKWTGQDNHGNKVVSGVYFYKLVVTAPQQTERIFEASKKLILL